VEIEVGERKGPTHQRGQCLRCGWTTDTISITKRESRALTGQRRFTRLCDECIGDLSGRPVQSLVGVHPSRRRLLTPHRRSVA